MARMVYSVLGALVLVLLVAQFFLEGLGVFTVFLQAESGQPAKDVFKTAEATFGVHVVNAIAISVSLLVMLVCSFIATAGSPPYSRSSEPNLGRSGSNADTSCSNDSQKAYRGPDLLRFQCLRLT